MPGSPSNLRLAGRDVTGDYALNVFNAQTADVFFSRGVRRIDRVRRAHRRRDRRPGGAVVRARRRRRRLRSPRRDDDRALRPLGGLRSRGHHLPRPVRAEASARGADRSDGLHLPGRDRFRLPQSPPALAPDRRIGVRPETVGARHPRLSAALQRARRTDRRGRLQLRAASALAWRREIRCRCSTCANGSTSASPAATSPARSSSTWAVARQSVAARAPLPSGRACGVEAQSYFEQQDRGRVGLLQHGDRQRFDGAYVW